MEAVAVLTDNVVEDPAPLQLHEGHVGGRGEGPLRRRRRRRPLPGRPQRPDALGAAEVGDPRRRADPRAREDDELPTFPHQLCQPCPHIHRWPQRGCGDGGDRDG